VDWEPAPYPLGPKFAALFLEQKPFDQGLHIAKICIIEGGLPKEEGREGDEHKESQEKKVP
jgi:hypothetical protein